MPMSSPKKGTHMKTTTKNEMLIDALLRAATKGRELEKMLKKASRPILDPEEWKNTRESLFERVEDMLEAYAELERVVDEVEQPVEAPDLDEAFSNLGWPYDYWYEFVNECYYKAYELSAEFDSLENA